MDPEKLRRVKLLMKCGQQGIDLTTEGIAKILGADEDQVKKALTKVGKKSYLTS